jgi:hypothetical protein
MKRKNDAIQGQANWAKRALTRGQDNTGIPLDQKVDQVEEQTYLSTNISYIILHHAAQFTKFNVSRF